RSGPALSQLLNEELCAEIVGTVVVPDEQALIRSKLINWADNEQVDLIITSGGTGFAPRDITPEVTNSVIDRPAPGLVEVMRAQALQITPHAMLSRAVAGIRGKTLIINLPGSPKGAVENLGFILSVIPHAVDLLRESKTAESGHHFQKPT
ncbi:MAG: MogA/MoaB family molybdenum cofactor biosynthesis protein, partial [Anaerolineae bacterium]|nr:MogA/MoaB family molybdenum cofactor biosynthesis protein [Anaerolineae bacterium]